MPMQREQAVGLPWAATAAALTAFSALTVAGGVSPMLPLLGLGLLAAHVFRARIEPADWWALWALRLVLYTAVATLNANKPNEGLIDSMLSASFMDTVGQWAAAELVIQAWRRQPARPPAAVSMILLSALTLTASCQSTDEQYPRLFVPVYMVFLLMSLAPRSAAGAGLRWAAFALALGTGAATYEAVWTNRAALTVWGTYYLEGRHTPETTGLSEGPVLGETFGLRGSPRRVLRIEGLNGITYLRGMAFDTYTEGSWGPQRDARPYVQARLAATGLGTWARVTPVAGTDGVLLAPLNCAGLDAGDNVDLQWARDTGGPLRVRAAQLAPYAIIQSADPDHQGPLATPPSPAELQRCRAVPASVNPRVRGLAAGIAGPERDPRRQVAAVEWYLMAHHRYSLTIHPGPGDPVSHFLLDMPPKGAHCEYFASSAVILLRCLGLPARYVVGYYAHESDEPGVTVVRQRDAHAWAEAWIAGTGWVTVDATPGDGRPEGDLNSVPFWQRLAERLADAAVSFRAWLLGLNWPHAAAFLAVAALLAMLIRGLWQFLRRPGGAARGEAAYSLDNAELAEIGARFEEMMTREGFACPPTRPWQEHLNVSGLEPAAREFVQVYNQVRFGHVPGGEASRLPALLAEAERRIKSAREQT